MAISAGPLSDLPDRPRGPRALIVLAAALACILTLSACGYIARLPLSRAFSLDLRFDVQVAQRLNNGFPVAVDLVVVDDEALLAELKKLDAATWFAQRDQYRRDHPRDLALHSWEWVPGEAVAEQSVRYRLATEGAVMFALYYTPGAHRAAVDMHRDLLLTLGEDGFTIEPRRR